MCLLRIAPWHVRKWRYRAYALKYKTSSTVRRLTQA